MVGWHHRLNGHEFEQTPGDGEGQGSLACCSPWGCKESDTTERLNNNSLTKLRHLCTQTWGSKGESQWGPVVVVDISVALSSLTLHPQIRSGFKGKAFLRTWDPSLCQAVTLGHAFVNRK